MTHRDSRHLRARLGVLLALSLALSACREDDAQTLPSTTDTAPVQRTNGAWLEPSSNEKPAAFLSRLSQEDEAELAPLLEGAATRYSEGPRMIANRIGQLWQDLQIEDQEVTVKKLLSEFNKINPGPERSISSRLQRYRVLRDQGLDHAQAIATLSKDMQ